MYAVKPCQQGFGQPADVSPPAAADKACVSAVQGLHQAYAFGYVAGFRQCIGGHEGVVLCVDEQGGDGDAGEIGEGRCAGVIVFPT